MDDLTAQMTAVAKELGHPVDAATLALWCNRFIALRTMVSVTAAALGIAPGTPAFSKLGLALYHASQLPDTDEDPDHLVVRLRTALGGRPALRVATTDGVPSGEVQFRDPRTGALLGRIVNIETGRQGVATPGAGGDDSA